MGAGAGADTGRPAHLVHDLHIVLRRHLKAQSRHPALLGQLEVDALSRGAARAHGVREVLDLDEEGDAVVLGSGLHDVVAEQGSLVDVRRHVQGLLPFRSHTKLHKLWGQMHDARPGHAVHRLQQLRQLMRCHHLGLEFHGSRSRRRANAGRGWLRSGRGAAAVYLLYGQRAESVSR